MQIAAITTVRNDRLFLRKWIDYYGANFGRRNLFVIIDGHDQDVPAGCEGVNFLHLPHRNYESEIASVPMRRVGVDHNRSRAVSDLARALWRYDYQAIMAMDVDEFLIADPARHTSLRAYVEAAPRRYATLSGLGLDVVQHLGKERAIDPARPFLLQRSHAVVSHAYTKPVLAFRPVTWGGGFHRVKRRNYHIGQDLFLLHFGLIDYETAMGRVNDPNLIKSGWGPHLQRRHAAFRHVEASVPQGGDAVFPKARRRLTWVRKLLAWNKPARLPGEPVVILPERFAGLL
ncbi:MAG: glycosyltransferase family 2 protein [Paracoccaceae bacterium]